MPARPLGSLIPALRQCALPALSLGTMLAACNGGSSGVPTASYTVGGTVSGLSGSGLVLTDNGGNALSVPANAIAFTFSTAVQSGNPFNVAVMIQPGKPSQTCMVANAAGTITGNNITNVAVSCTTNSYTLSGNVSGLTGSGLTLTDKNGGTVAVPATGPFTFTLPKAVQSGTAYNVTVATDPVSPPQGCSVANGSGTITGNAVTDVTVTCNDTAEQLIVVGGDTLYRYLIDPNSGSIGPASGSAMALPVAGGDMIVDPSGGFLYSTYTDSEATIAAYAVGAGTGDLTPVNGSPFTVAAGGLQPQASPMLLIDPTGKFLYASGAAGAFAFVRNATTGALTAVAGNPFPAALNTQSAGMGLCDVCPGAFLGASASFLYYDQPGPTGTAQVGGYAIDTSTGALTSLGYLTAVGGFPPLAVASVNPSGAFLFVAGSSPETYSINTTTGALAPTTYPLGGMPAIVVNATGTFAYTSDGIQVWAYSINAATGALTALAGSPFMATGGTLTGGTATGPVGPRGMAFDSSGKFLYVGNYTAFVISGFAVDATTGALSPVPGSPFAVPNEGPEVILGSAIP